MYYKFRGGGEKKKNKKKKKKGKKSRVRPPTVARYGEKLIIWKLQGMTYVQWSAFSASCSLILNI